MHEHVTTQLIDISDDAHLYLEDVLDHVFEQGFVDPKLRSVVWWEDSTSVRLKASSAVQDLLLRGAGSTPETALRLIIGLYFLFLSEGSGLIEISNAEDIPTTIWVHYEYADGAHPDTATQRFRLDPPHCERLTHLTEHIFAKGYLPCKARSLVSWKGACGKHVKENAEVEDVLSWGEGLCEEKPLRLVISESRHG